jgi:amino acid permease
MSLIWYNIRDFVVSIVIFWQKIAANEEKWLSWSHFFERYAVSIMIWLINFWKCWRAITNEQSRDTVKTGHIRHRTKTKQWNENKLTQHRKLKRWATRIGQKNRGWTQVLVKGKKFQSLIKHLPYYCCDIFVSQITMS